MSDPIYVHIGERDLPPLWDPLTGAFNDERVRWYTELTVSSGLFRGGRAVIPEFIAAMMWESQLDNLVVGNNAKNGADNVYLGIGWCQLDTGYHCKTMGTLHELRRDPGYAIEMIAETPDLCKHGKKRSYFNKQRWHAWEAETIDPEEGWNALEVALKVWDEAGY